MIRLTEKEYGAGAADAVGGSFRENPPGVVPSRVGEAFILISTRQKAQKISLKSVGGVFDPTTGDR